MLQKLVISYTFLNHHKIPRLITALKNTFHSLNIRNYVLSVIRFLVLVLTRYLVLFTMTDPAATQVFDTSIATEASIFSFDTTDWVDPPIFVTELPETSEESNIRILGEKEYRASVTPTLLASLPHAWSLCNRWFHFRFSHGEH